MAEPARIFVYSQIGGTDGERFAFEFFNHFAIDGKLFVFRGQGVAIEVEELAAEQADAVGTGFVEGFDVVGRFDIGQ